MRFKGQQVSYFEARGIIFKENYYGKVNIYVKSSKFSLQNLQRSTKDKICFLQNAISTLHTKRLKNFGLEIRNKYTRKKIVHKYYYYYSVSQNGILTLCLQRLITVMLGTMTCLDGTNITKAIFD
jgi:hypothetical protein